MKNLEQQVDSMQKRVKRKGSSRSRAVGDGAESAGSARTGLSRRVRARRRVVGTSGQGRGNESQAGMSDSVSQSGSSRRHSHHSRDQGKYGKEA